MKPPNPLLVMLITPFVVFFAYMGTLTYQCMLLDAKIEKLQDYGIGISRHKYPQGTWVHWFSDRLGLRPPTHRVEWVGTAIFEFEEWVPHPLPKGAGAKHLEAIAELGKSEEATFGLGLGTEALELAFRLETEHLSVCLVEGDPLPPDLGFSKIPGVRIKVRSVTGDLLRSLGTMQGLMGLELEADSYLASPAEWRAFISQSRSLNEIDLRDGEIGNEALTAIADSGTVKFIYCEGNCLSKEVLGSLRGNKRLKHLMIRDCEDAPAWLSEAAALSLPFECDLPKFYGQE